jgi:hypothetical protein
MVKWLLEIPSRRLLYDPAKELTLLSRGVQDDRLHLHRSSGLTGITDMECLTSLSDASGKHTPRQLEILQDHR